MCRRAGASGRASRSTSICAWSPPAGADAPWTVERVYQTFPRLYERRTSGGSQLSGGEQQMLAIGRALLGNPHLLVMDEPTEGLAPVIVEQVEAHAGAARRRGRHGVLRHRAEHRRGDRGVRSRRHHGQRPHQPGDGGAARSPPTASCSSACSASAGRTKRTSCRRRRPRPARAPKR